MVAESRQSDGASGPKQYRMHNGVLQGLYVLGIGGLCEWRRILRRDELPEETLHYD
jgi:hypothetical protein